MDKHIEYYKQQFNLNNATFNHIEHDDAIVAVVYKITTTNGTNLILKISNNDAHYHRELYFLNLLSDTARTPKIIDHIAPTHEFKGAILMEYLSGNLLTEISKQLAYEIGSTLAMIHSHRLTGYGDVTKPDSLETEPRKPFIHKLNEALSECRHTLPEPFIESCQSYFSSNANLLDGVDGPCITHRDFRPGNLIVKDRKLQGVIDWASSRASFAEEDFCPLESGEWSISEPCKKSFLEGYASIRPIPEYEAIMPLLTLSRAEQFKQSASQLKMVHGIIKTLAFIIVIVSFLTI